VVAGDLLRFWWFAIRRGFPLDVSVLYPPAAATDARDHARGVAAPELPEPGAWWAGDEFRGRARDRLRALGVRVGGAPVRDPRDLRRRRRAGGLAIDRLLDLDAIRSRVSLASSPDGAPGSLHRTSLLRLTHRYVRAITPRLRRLRRDAGAQANRRAWRGVRVGVLAENVTRAIDPSLIIALGPIACAARVRSALRVDPRHVRVAERAARRWLRDGPGLCAVRLLGHEMRTGLERGLSTR